MDLVTLRKKLSVMKMLGVPYDDETVQNGDLQAGRQAEEIADKLRSEGAPDGLKDKEIIALIAYMQSLGQKHNPGKGE